MPFFRRSARRADHLTQRQRDVVARLERGELSAEEAARLLAEPEPEVANPASGTSPEAPPGGEPAERPETPEETAARELVERIAREAYGDPSA